VVGGGGLRFGGDRRLQVADDDAAGGTVDDRGGFWAGGSEGAGDHVQACEQPERLAGPVEVTDGAAGDFEGGGRVVEARGEKGGERDNVGVLVAERGVTVETLTEAGAGLVGIAVGECDAENQQSMGDGVGHVDLAGEGSRFRSQGNGTECVTGTGA
jgi:hypothetical protein